MNFFLAFSPPPPPPHHFSNGPSLIAGQHIVDAAVLQLTMYERYAEAFSSVWVLSEFPKTTLKYIFKNTRSFFLSKEWRQVVGNSKSIT